ncbi:MAG: efflux RND transporter permease subunit [Gammaproteobacteria bacterium]|nr:efflux RND transporter permease subunit [Gammaproteobacteria bacterium]
MIRFFAAHPTAANLMMLAFILAGALTATSLQRETLPQIEPREIRISVAFPGARPEEVEEAICRRIEDALESVENTDTVSCEAREGLAQANVEMKEGEDLDRFLAKVKTEVDAIDDFPDKAESPVIEQLGTTEFVVSVAITGFDRRTDLKAYALAVKDRMLQWGGISQIDVKGFSEHQIRIEMSEVVLRQYGLSVADVADIIDNQSFDLPGGTIEATERQVSVRFAEQRKRVKEFLDLIIASNTDGGIIRLGDMATITDRFNLNEDRIEFNGRPAALLDISKTSNEDMLTMVDTVRAFVKHEQQTAPPGITLTVTNDSSSIVRDRLRILIDNGLQGLALVFAVMFLFFGFRYSFWVTMGLPVSMLGALAIMLFMGLSLNMMTMLGLLIAVGLLMDDAIVISENIAAHRDRGKTPLDAAVDGAAEVFPSIFASFLTTAMVLGSLIFLEGDTGQVLKVVPMVMLFVLSISLVEAFLILPRHLEHSMAHVASEQPRIQATVNAGLYWLREHIVGVLVDLCMRWRYVTLGIAIAILMSAIAMLVGGILKFSVFPDMDGDVVEARILLPQGTPLTRTESVVGNVERALARLNAELTPHQPDGRDLVEHVTIQYNKNVDAYETGSHVATVSADLLSAEIRTTSSDELIVRWREAVGDIADVVAIKFTETIVGPAGIAIEIRLKGYDIDRLKAASLDLQNWLNSYKGVTNLSDDLRPGKHEVRLGLREQAASLGITARTIANQLRTAFYGATVSEIQVGPESYEIDVRLAAADRDSVADLEQFTITVGDGDFVPLKAIARFEEERGYARINRYQRARTITVQGDVDLEVANTNAILNDTQARFIDDLKQRYPDVEIELGGQNEEGAKTQKSMIAGFGIGMIGVFLLLSFQFRSYIEPIVVMIIIPLSFVGVVYGHIAMGLDFTMPSLLGFVAMAGVVVNNSILLVNFIKEHHKHHSTVADAAPQAARARFRAILITTLTTIAGLLPILSETSLQAQILIPMVASLAFGLLASVVMVLFVVPAIYAILDDFGLSTLATERQSDELEENHAHSMSAR